MNKKTVLSLCILSLSLLTLVGMTNAVKADGANERQIGAWGISDYSGTGLSDIWGATDADAFYDGMPYWAYQWSEPTFTKSMSFYNIYCREDHWEKESVGGDSPDFVDSIDIAWISAHGSSNPYVYFSRNTDGDGYYTWKFYKTEVFWGEDDLEWVILSACSTLNTSTAWNGVWGGLHGICGYSTTSYSFITGAEGDWAAYYLSDSSYGTGDAWQYASIQVQPSTTGYPDYYPVRGAIDRVIVEIDDEEVDYYDEPMGDSWDDYGEPGVLYDSRAWTYWGC